MHSPFGGCMHGENEWHRFRLRFLICTPKRYLYESHQSVRQSIKGIKNHSKRIIAISWRIDDVGSPSDCRNTSLITWYALLPILRRRSLLWLLLKYRRTDGYIWTSPQSAQFVPRMNYFDTHVACNKCTLKKKRHIHHPAKDLWKNF